MSRTTTFCVLAVFTFASAGCSTLRAPEQARDAARALPQGISASIVDATAPTETITAVRHYQIGPGDQLKISLKGADTPVGTVTVDEKGQAKLPFSGNRYVNGDSIKRLESLVANAREDETGDPTAVIIELTNARNIYVLGEVQKSGMVSYQKDLTLGQALAQRGGATYKADARQIFIKTRHGEEEIAVAFDPALPLLPGDVVWVRERIF